eukprot:Nk52_evm40s96 gene=Nk52_evmTU40s96
MPIANSPKDCRNSPAKFDAQILLSESAAVPASTPCDAHHPSSPHQSRHGHYEIQRSSTRDIEPVAPTSGSSLRGAGVASGTGAAHTGPTSSMISPNSSTSNGSGGYRGLVGVAQSSGFESYESLRLAAQYRNQSISANRMDTGKGFSLKAKSEGQDQLVKSSLMLVVEEESQTRREATDSAELKDEEQRTSTLISSGLVTSSTDLHHKPLSPKRIKASGSKKGKKNSKGFFSKFSFKRKRSSSPKAKNVKYEQQELPQSPVVCDLEKKINQLHLPKEGDIGDESNILPENGMQDKQKVSELFAKKESHDSENVSSPKEPHTSIFVYMSRSSTTQKTVIPSSEVHSKDAVEGTRPPCHVNLVSVDRREKASLDLNNRRRMKSIPAENAPKSKPQRSRSLQNPEQTFIHAEHVGGEKVQTWSPWPATDSIEENGQPAIYAVHVHSDRPCREATAT